MAALLPPNIAASALPKPLSEVTLQARQAFGSYEVKLWEVTRNTPTGSSVVIRTRRVGVKGFQLNTPEGRV
jgi:hypothetical protein